MAGSDELPADFDAQAYLAYHPDVAAAGIDAATHYLAHGRREGRLYRRQEPKSIEGSRPSVEEPYGYSNLHLMAQPPTLALAHQGAALGPSSRAIAGRLIAAYQFSTRSSEQPVAAAADLWTDIANVHLKNLVGCLTEGKVSALTALLSSFGAEYTWFGGITLGVDGFNHWGRDESQIAYSYFDKLVALAEAIGALPVENPEQGWGGNWGKNIRRSPDEVVGLIESKLGISILPPLGILPVSGIKLANGLLHYRHINALYAAIRIQSLTEATDAICEYGGGIGLVAMYVSRFGRSDYTLFDLPLVNVLSGYMLMMALGEDAVCLEGEDQASNRIKIRGGSSCHLEADGRFTLALNQDSFPEIDRAIVLDYLREIHRTTKKYFLSINHEVEHATTHDSKHLNVAALLEGDERFNKLYRMPYWLRRGYVEELYLRRG